MNLLDEEINHLSEPPMNNEATYFCPVTNHPLYTVSEERTELHHSYGTCRKCGIDYAKEAMWFPNGHKDPWPVHYIGTHCTTCWDKLPWKKLPKKKQVKKDA